MVVVVIGFGVGAGAAKTDEVASGVANGTMSWARSRAAAASTMEKMMAERIIDGLQHETVA